MKYLLPVFAFLVLNCTYDEAAYFEKNSLNGTWHLKSYGGGVSGQFTHYKIGEVTWVFDTITKTVSIKNRHGYFGPNNGIYLYELRPIEDEDYELLYFNDSTSGGLFLQDHELFYDQGLIATFSRY